MTLFQVGCELDYQVHEPGAFLFQVCALNDSSQRIQNETWVTDPPFSILSEVLSETGNRYLRLKPPKGSFTFRYSAAVEKQLLACSAPGSPDTGIESLPLDLLPYLYPSRYCESDRFARFAQEEFGDRGIDDALVAHLCDWIHERIVYTHGSSDAHTTAADTLLERAGVCRDFAHLGIALCRALRIPARYVANYAYQLDPPDFHACFEAYLAGRWLLFDPTRLAPIDGFIRIGTGRDAADAAFASYYGQVEMGPMRVFCEKIDPQSVPPAPLDQH